MTIHSSLQMSFSTKEIQIIVAGIINPVDITETLTDKARGIDGTVISHPAYIILHHRTVGMELCDLLRLIFKLYGHQFSCPLALYCGLPEDETRVHRLQTKVASLSEPILESVRRHQVKRPAF